MKLCVGLHKSYVTWTGAVRNTPPGGAQNAGKSKKQQILFNLNNKGNFIKTQVL